MKSTLTLLFGLLLMTGVQAQDAVNWSFSSKKIADNTYEITMTANVSSPWHIYSQNTPDGGPQPTEIKFTKNPLVTLEGKAKEVGKVIKKYEDVFGIDVLYFDGKAQFVQIVKVKGKAKPTISGTISYMACTDQECLPPADVPFSIALK